MSNVQQQQETKTDSGDYKGLIFDETRAQPFIFEGEDFLFCGYKTINKGSFPFFLVPKKVEGKDLYYELPKMQFRIEVQNNRSDLDSMIVAKRGFDNYIEKPEGKRLPNFAYKVFNTFVSKHLASKSPNSLVAYIKVGDGDIRSLGEINLTITNEDKGESFSLRLFYGGEDLRVNYKFVRSIEADVDTSINRISGFSDHPFLKGGLTDGQPSLKDRQTLFPESRAFFEQNAPKPLSVEEKKKKKNDQKKKRKEKRKERRRQEASSSSSMDVSSFSYDDSDDPFASSMSNSSDRVVAVTQDKNNNNNYVVSTQRGGHVVKQDNRKTSRQLLKTATNAPPTRPVQISAANALRLGAQPEHFNNITMLNRTVTHDFVLTGDIRIVSKQYEGARKVKNLFQQRFALVRDDIVCITRYYEGRPLVFYFDIVGSFLGVV